MILPNYKFYPAKIIVFLFLTVFLFSFSGCSGESKITEAEVLDLINRMDAAAESKDAEAFASFLSERAQIKTTVVLTGGKSENSSINRDQYRDLVKRVFAAATNYSHKRQNTKVKISDDGKSAIVTSELAESMTINGQVISSIETGASSFVKENGKLVMLFVNINARQV